MVQLTKSKEAVSLLKLLLSEDQEYRQRLAVDLHYRKSAISAVTLRLSILEKQLNTRKKIDPSTLRELRNDLNQFCDDLRPIHLGVSPSPVYLFGLISPLRSFAASLMERSDVKITIDSPDFENDLMPKSEQARIFRISTSILEFLCKTGYKAINLTVDMAATYVEFLIVGSVKKKSTWQIMEIDKSLHLIKALLIWQDTKVLESTDWKKVFCLRFVLTSKGDIKGSIKAIK